MATPPKGDDPHYENPHGTPPDHMITPESVDEARRRAAERGDGKVIDEAWDQLIDPEPTRESLAGSPPPPPLGGGGGFDPVPPTDTPDGPTEDHAVVEGPDLEPSPDANSGRSLGWFGAVAAFLGLVAVAVVGIVVLTRPQASAQKSGATTPAPVVGPLLPLGSLHLEAQLTLVSVSSGCSAQQKAGVPNAFSAQWTSAESGINHLNWLGIQSSTTFNGTIDNSTGHFTMVSDPGQLFPGSVSGVIMKASGAYSVTFQSIYDYTPSCSATFKGVGTFTPTP
jgi:hypothetical protein